ncbi:MAG TPA: hypothetical protein VD790_12060 [Thermoleophilaceae bacterium]|nr:hypothetical protein [Thermoleophilaceae bacterium]
MVRLLALASLVALATAAPAYAVGEVPAGKTLVVIGQSGIERADAFAAETGTDPAGAMWYAGLYEEPEAFEGVLDQIDAAVASHPGLVVDLGVSFGAVSTPSPSYAAAIAAGNFDDRIALLAEHLAELPTVAYLRLGYEFDLLGGQYGPPAVYKAAYRHIVDELRAAGVANASFVWHSAGAFWRATDPSLLAAGTGTLAQGVSDAPVDIDPQPIDAFYPGDEYVDAFGISYWQDSCCFGRSGEAARAVYEQRTREILDQARAMGLPLRISESTPVYVGADSEEESVEWLDKTFALIEEYDIGAWNLISIDWQEGGFFAAPFWNGYWPDARIHHFRETRERFLAGVADDRYVQRTPPAERAPEPTPGFRTASGAIRCHSKAAHLRCDVRRVESTPRRRGCVPRRGRSVVVSSRGKARSVCGRRAVAAAGLPVLRRGSAWHRGGVRCRSREAKVKCRNRSGHGFTLGRGLVQRF